jgi:hypothetical protein
MQPGVIRKRILPVSAVLGTHTPEDMQRVFVPDTALLSDSGSEVGKIRSVVCSSLLLI